VFEIREQGRGGAAEHHVRVIKQYMGGGFGSKQIA
jgi:CO/xanthine dehydrogenase Mo-binding subunit